MIEKKRNKEERNCYHDRNESYLFCKYFYSAPALNSVFYSVKLLNNKFTQNFFLLLFRDYILPSWKDSAQGERRTNDE